jgi:phospholipid/cholesterol/gamma-HCH transport system substrate-binding protein
VCAEVKPFSERNLLVIGAIGLALTIGIVVGALQYDKLPFLNQTKEYSAYFAEAGGITDDAGVQVSGFQVGKVTSIELDGPRVLIKFTVQKNIRLGDRTEAAIKTKGLLGTKILEVYSRGEGQQEGTIPLDRTTSPYQLPDALGELATTISGLNTNQLSDSLRVLSETFADTPPELKIAVEGVARFSETLNERDAQLRGLLTNADKTTAVLAERSNQIVGLVSNTNALLAELQNQSAALDQISGNISALSQQLQGFTRQAQRGAHDPRQPQGTTSEVARAAHQILDVPWRIGGFRALLQDLRRESAAGTVRATVHRRRVLRPRS